MKAQKAALSSAEADAAAAEAGYKAGEDNIATWRPPSTGPRPIWTLRCRFQRGEAALQGWPDSHAPITSSARRLIDSQKAAMAEAESRIVQARSQLAQLKAQFVGTQKKIAQTQAGLTRRRHSEKAQRRSRRSTVW